MNPKNIEVEVRGPLTKDERDDLNAFLAKNAALKQCRERVIIDYSSGIAKRTKDIRIRETNGVPEIIIKLGSWGGSEKREEISLHIGKGAFDDLAKTFGELGFTRGMLCVRNSMVYQLNNIEFAVVEVPNHSYYFEAEILTTEGNIQSAEAELKKTCAELGLKLFTDQSFFAYIERLNKESNSIFEYKNYQPGYFRNKRYLNETRKR